MNNRSVRGFYDTALYGREPALDAGLAMLRAFPNPSEREMKKLDVLEVGTGRGQWSVALAALAHRYVGLDISHEAVRTIRTLVGTQTSRGRDVVQGDVLMLPFEDRSFDAIYCIGVLHHTACPFSGFVELFRVLRDNGVMNLMLYGRVWPRNLLRDLVYQLSRLSPGLQRAIPYAATRLEAWRLPDAVAFNGAGNHMLYKDWYLAPIQHRHTLAQVSSWTRRVGGTLNYVFLDPYRNTLARQQRWARHPVLKYLFCPDFMFSVQKTRSESR